MKNLDVPGPGAWALVWDGADRPLPIYANWRWSLHGTGVDGRAVAVGRHTASVPDGPYVHEADGCVVAARGLLTNRAELRSAGIDGADDGQRILAAYRRWGRECCAHLTGTFAFTIWDGDQLVAGRDRLGLEPVYRYLARDVTIVTNDVDTIFGFPDLTVSPDPEFVVLQVARQNYQAQTVHREIRRLMPAHIATAKRPGDFGATRWWEPEVADRPSTIAEDSAAMRELLLTSVESIHRSSSASVDGAELSGGLDSSAVVGALTPLLAADGRSLPTFSQVLPIGSDHPNGDEREYIGAVLEMMNDGDPGRVQAHWILPFDRESERFDRPSTRSTLSGIGGGKEKLIARAAMQGVTDLWSGFGGDEYATFNGRNYHGHLLLNGKLITLAREAKHRATVRKSKPLGVLKGSVVQAKNLVEDQRWWPLDTSISATDLYLTPALDRVVDVADMAGYDRLSIRDTLRDTQRLLLALHPGASRAERENSTALRYGVMFRFPLEDHRFVELSMSLNPDRHMRDGWHRWLWREATEGIMPDAVRWRNDKRPPMPGGATSDEINARIADRDVAHDALHPIAREWIDVDRAEREMTIGAANPASNGQNVLTPRRALNTAYQLSAEANRNGW